MGAFFRAKNLVLCLFVVLLVDFCLLNQEISKIKGELTMKEISREENIIGRFTNWVDTIARRVKYLYIETESKHISHICIDEVPEVAFRTEQVEITYIFTAGNDKFEFETEWLDKAFDELGKTHKRLLTLLYIENKTPHEAAAILGCTVENVYNQRYKAFKIIKKIKKEGESDESVE